MVFNGENVSDGVRLVAHFLGFYLQILNEKGIYHDQTAYLPLEVDASDILDVEVAESTAMDVDGSFLRHASMVALVCDICDAAYMDLLNEPRPRAKFLRICDSWCAQEPEINEFIRLINGEIDDSQWRPILDRIYEKFVRSWWLRAAN